MFETGIIVKLSSQGTRPWWEFPKRMHDENLRSRLAHRQHTVSGSGSGKIIITIIILSCNCLFMLSLLKVVSVRRAETILCPFL